MNLFNYDNIHNGAVSPTSSNTGEIVTRNNYAAYRIGAGPFWSGENATSNNIAIGQFAANTSYIFDIWLDTDDLVYQEVNRPGGLTVRYTDDTYASITATGSSTSPKGFQHIIFESDASKTISGCGVYYWIGTPGYYRLDSTITKKSTVKPYKTGIITVETFDDFGTQAEVHAGYISNTDIIEY